MKKLNLIDEIVNEPLGGAHRNKEETYKIVSDRIFEHFEKLKKLSPEELVENRIEKYNQMGEFKSK